LADVGAFEPGQVDLYGTAQDKRENGSGRQRSEQGYKVATPAPLRAIGNGFVVDGAERLGGRFTDLRERLPDAGG